MGLWCILAVHAGYDGGCVGCNFAAKWRGNGGGVGHDDIYYVDLLLVSNIGEYMVVGSDATMFVQVES